MEHVRTWVRRFTTGGVVTYWAGSCPNGANETGYPGGTRLKTGDSAALSRAVHKLSVFASLITARYLGSPTELARLGSMANA